MIVETDEAGTARLRALIAALAATFLVGTAACARSVQPATSEPTVLRIGFGSTKGENTQTGLRQYMSVAEREGLLAFGRDGRPQPWLAESWTVSDDGLRLRLQLRPNARFHDGKPVTATALAPVLKKQLPDYLGPTFEDIADIVPASDSELEFVFKRRSTFLLEGLDLLIDEPGSHAGTGPFVAAPTSSGSFELNGVDQYYGGKPSIDRIVIKTYPSTRAAWAELLRGEVDMLYEVGIDAIDSLKPSNNVKVFTQQRSYAYVFLLNVHKPSLSDRAIRRQLNDAIDRKALIADSLSNHGRPADGPVWPWHWAYDETLPRFDYRPVPLKKPLTLTCLFADPSLERLAVTVQQQLMAIGVELKLELLPLDDWYARVLAGNFEMVLADANAGPTMLRPYRFWHTGGPYNWGHFSSDAVDAALDGIRHAPDDAAYKAGVAAFQRAVVDDPPAIFLAWSERARAVSTRFDVPVEPGRDILSTLRLWKPITAVPATTQ